MKKHLLYFALIAMMIGMAAMFAGCGDSADTGDNAGQETNADISGVAKIDGDKEWVYDADYSLPTDVDSFYGYSDHSKLIQVSDLVVPYINIDSDDAKAANDEIYGMYEKLIEQFNEDSKEGVWFTVSSYKAYNPSGAISVLIDETSEGTDVPWHEYTTYTFSKEDGSLMDFDAACAAAGITADQATETVEKEIEYNILKDFADAEDIDSYVDKSVEGYEASVKDGSVGFYIDNDSQLNVVVNEQIPAGGGSANVIIPAY